MTSFRKIKPYLYIPIALLELLLSKIFYIPHLNYKYYVNAAIFDTNMNLGIPDKKESNILEQVQLKYIKNKKMKLSLYLSGLFGKWYIYKKTQNIDSRRNFDKNREIIYLTKDKKFNSTNLCYSVRVSDSLLNRKYGRIENYLKKIKLQDVDFYKIEPQIFIIIALKSEKHNIIEKERKKIKNYKIKKSLEKEVKRMIKTNNLFSNKKIYGIYDDKPVIHNVVELNRIDLMIKILDSAEDDEERCKLVNYRTWKGEYNLFKKPKEFAKSDEMKKLLEKWEDLEKYNRYRKIMKIKKGIK